MPSWPRHPTVFEINTWVWLSELSRKYGAPLDLSSVPRSEWDAVAEYGFDAVWLMGVWERSPAGIGIANRNQGLLDEFQRALPDYRLPDNVGSPYCVRRYIVDARLGGPAGLAAARRELAKRGMRLILDFVANHLAPDHPWVTEHPEYFIGATEEDVRDDAASFLRIGSAVFACGRDPYFPAWPDVLQLNAFGPGLRQSVRATVSDIACQCDGVRCDMAMLLLNEVFERTWGSRAGPPPPLEYWAELIPAVKRSHLDFLFIAEAYWDLEWELQQQGFDFCYDKRLYDRLEHGDAETVRLHLSADLSYQERLLRFIENHDEPRAAATFGMERERAAAVVIATLPGARLFHEGQFEGRRVRAPVFLGRRTDEAADTTLVEFYRRLLRTTTGPVFRRGTWSLCECTGWPDNSTFRNLIAWTWVSDDGRYLIVVNLSSATSQARVRIPWADSVDDTWRFVDAISGATYDRSANEVRNEGLYVELAGWQFHILRPGDRLVGDAR